MKKFLETYKLPKLNHKEIEKLRPIKSKHNESISKNLLGKKVPIPYGFIGEFYQTLQRINASPQTYKNR